MVKENENKVELYNKMVLDKGVRHYILQTKWFGDMDVVEFKEYEKVKKQNQNYQQKLKELREKVPYKFVINNINIWEEINKILEEN